MISGANAPDPHARPPDRRKLVAVLYADMVGYSRLIGLDDQGTLQRLRALRRDLIDPAIEEHGGRIVQTGGDSLLVVFDSIDGAVRCAVKVQEQIPVHDGDQPAGRAIGFRIGIDLGDAIPDGTDLHGDAVNVAARLQAECPTGRICISRSVRDHVHGRLGLGFAELGTLSLKNIVQPVEAFLIRLDGTTLPKSVERSLVYDTSEILPLPDRPSIAVLAFTNMSDDATQEYFSDGIAEDIITELSRHHELFVTSRNSSFTYRGRSVDVKQVGRELGVRYVVEGSVRREGKQARVTVQLIEADSGNHIWAERYDHEVEQVFVVQTEIAEMVAATIHPVLGDVEQRRAIRKPPSSLSAWETYQQGRWYFSRLTVAGNEQARQLFAKAATIDVNFPPPYVGLSQTYVRDTLYHGTRPTAEAARLAIDAARKAVAIDPNDPAAQAALSSAFITAGDFAAALIAVDHALSLDRNSAGAHEVKGAVLILTGHYAEGRGEELAALRLNPRDPISCAGAALIAASYYHEENYEAALEAGEKCLVNYPNYPSPRRYIVAALAQLGRIEEATAALHELFRLAPEWVDINLRNRPPFYRVKEYEHILDGLRKAGWQG